jgi:hypothetical protein
MMMALRLQLTFGGGGACFCAFAFWDVGGGSFNIVFGVCGAAVFVSNYLMLNLMLIYC